MEGCLKALGGYICSPRQVSLLVSWRIGSCHRDGRGDQEQASKTGLRLQREAALEKFCSPLLFTTTLPQGSVPCNSGSPPNHSLVSTSKDIGTLDSEGANKGQVILLARNPELSEPIPCSGTHTNMFFWRTFKCLIQMIRTCPP